MNKKYLLVFCSIAKSLEWGASEQVDAENMACEMFEDMVHGDVFEKFETYALKATTEEMMDYIIAEINHTGKEYVVTWDDGSYKNCPSEIHSFDYFKDDIGFSEEDQIEVGYLDVNKSCLLGMGDVRVERLK